MMTAHSKSMPSTSYLLTMVAIASMNLVRFVALPTAEEKYCEPVHPPMHRVIFVPCGKD